MPRRECAECGAAFPCAPSFQGRAPKCGICRRATQGGRRHAPGPAAARDAPQTAQEGAAGAAAPQPGHMAPCACHCAACRAAGHNGTACVFLCAGLHDLFDGKADIVDVVLRQYHGACGWATARCDTAICCVQYGPAGDAITVFRRQSSLSNLPPPPCCPLSFLHHHVAAAATLARCLLFAQPLPRFLYHLSRAFVLFVLKGKK